MNVAEKHIKVLTDETFRIHEIDLIKFHENYKTAVNDSSTDYMHRIPKCV